MAKQRIEFDAFRERYGCDVATIPGNVALLGLPAAGTTWDLALTAQTLDILEPRVDAFLDFWLRRVRPHLPRRPIWLLLCYWDAWRERTPYSADFRWVTVDGPLGLEWRGEAGVLPRFSEAQPWVGCFGAQQGDPSALLVPEAHFLHASYRPLRARLLLERTRWDAKVERGMFAGSDHGEPGPDGTASQERSPRRTLAAVVEAEGLDVEVHFEGGVKRSRQIRHKYLLDVDGYVRTWDAWAWKLMSGSVVLSPGSRWETFFTRQFEPWEHFVPVAADFSDLGERLDWCRGNDAECRAIAERAGRRAREVYDPDRVGRSLATAIEDRLA